MAIPDGDGGMAAGAERIAEPAGSLALQARQDDT